MLKCGCEQTCPHIPPQSPSHTIHPGISFNAKLGEPHADITVCAQANVLVSVMFFLLVMCVEALQRW